MPNLQNFETEFGMHIQNEMPKVIRKINDEKAKFEALTLGLYQVLSVVDRALENEGFGFMTLKYDNHPETDNNYVHSTRFKVKNLNDEHEIEIYYVGGDATEVVVLGAQDFSHHLHRLKGFKTDVVSKQTRFDIDTSPDELASAFAALFTEFYTAR